MSYQIKCIHEVPTETDKNRSITKHVIRRFEHNADEDKIFKLSKRAQNRTNTKN